jgi:hypothetical protein
MDRQIYDKRIAPTIRLSPPSTPPRTAQDNRLYRSPSKPVRLSDDTQPTLTSIVDDDSLAVSQKDLALRVAHAANRIHEWHDELDRWRWTGSFDKEEGDIEEYTSGTSQETVEELLNQYVSLPLAQISAYETRLDAIHDELPQLDLDDLKERILDLHSGNSRPSSRGSTLTMSNLTFLDDFSFYVTKTLIRALPELSALNPQLKTWSTRLMVLQNIPQFFQNYRKAAVQMLHAWRNLDESEEQEHVEDHIQKEQHRLGSIKGQCHVCIVAAGGVLDVMLDTLEGQEDTLPDRWIDAFEAVEADFAEWCAAAHRRIFEARSAVSWIKPPDLAAIDERAIVTADDASNEWQRLTLLEESTPTKLQPQLLTTEPSDMSMRSDMQAHQETDPLVPPQIFNRNAAIEESRSLALIADEGMVIESRPQRPLALSCSSETIVHEGAIQAQQEPNMAKSSAARSTNEVPEKYRSPAFIADKIWTIPSEPPLPMAELSIAEATIEEYETQNYKQPESLSASDVVNINVPMVEQYFLSLDDEEIEPTKNPSCLLAIEGAIITPDDVAIAVKHLPSIDPEPKFYISAGNLNNNTQVKEQRSSPLNKEVATPQQQQDLSMASNHILPATPIREARQHYEATEFVHSFEPNQIDMMMSSAAAGREFIETTPQAEVHADNMNTTHVFTVESIESLSVKNEPDVSNRFSNDSDHSSKFSDQSLLGNSVLSELTTVDDITDATEIHEKEKSLRSDYLERPHTPDFYDEYEDATFLEDLSNLSVVSELDDDRFTMLEESPSERKRPISKAPKPPLNAMMKKKRPQRDPHLRVSALKLDKSSTHSRHGADRGCEDHDSPLQSPVSPVLPLELQISNILEAIPTPIRLRTGPKASAPEVKRTRMRTTSSQSRRPSISSRSATPSLTLAPAEEFSKKISSNGSDIRLYHLIQTGQDKPIKLFIRRVGENGERVMVRVGGGWADLGEYLRIYAEHHGRRAVSEGRIEIQALGSGKTGLTPVKGENRRASGLNGVSRSMTPTFGRSMTPTLGERASRSATPVLDEKTDTASLVGTPQISIDTPQSMASASSRRSAGWDEVGMAGPKTRRGEMSEEKKEWVEGIVEQAKRGMGKTIEVGDLGKSGSTRRIFFKGRKTSGVDKI